MVSMVVHADAVFVPQRQRKLQRDRLLSEFSAALNSFQKIQRQAADKEREFVARVRANSRVSVSQLAAAVGSDQNLFRLLLTLNMCPPAGGAA